MSQPYVIPRSTAFEKAREALKPFLKRLGPAYAWLADKWYWTKVFANYVAIRRGSGQGLWAQTIYVESTNICNARCVFCAYPQMERPKVTMSLEVFRSVVDQWTELGGDEVDLTPIVGDPFVDKHLFERLDYLAAHPRIRRFHFFTNAILMKPEYFERLCGYGARLTVYNSYGGFDRETYHKVMGVDKHAEAEAAIRGLIEAKRRTGSTLGIQVNLRSPLGTERGPFWDFVEAARRDGLISVDRMHAFDSWAGRIQEKDLNGAGLKARTMPEKRGPCQRLLTSPVILADGRVNACACRDVEASLVVGDAGKDALGGVFSGKALKDLIDSHEKPLEQWPDVCRRCTYYDSVYPRWLQGRLFEPVRRLLGVQ